MCDYIRKQKKKERTEETGHQNTANSGAPILHLLLLLCLSCIDTHMVKGVWWWGLFNSLEGNANGLIYVHSQNSQGGIGKTMKTSVRIELLMDPHNI